MGSFASAFSFPLGADPVVVANTTAATFVVDAEDARLTYEWRTDVLGAWSGKEQRVSLLERPRQRYSFRTVLPDAQYRLATAQIGRNVPDGATFLIGLPFEELTIASATGFGITVHSLATCDWAVDDQRIVIERNGEVADALITAVDSLAGTITLDVDHTATVAKAGARIMPGMVSYLDAQQSLSRYAVNAGEWTLAAMAAAFRWGASTTLPGVGATVNTYESLPVWDIGIQTAQASQPLHAGVDAQDLGFSAKQLYRWDEAQWGRALRVESTRTADWQWLKRFLHTVRGRAKAFLLPTGRPDLVAVSDASTGTLTITDANDYVTNWWPSLAHRRIKLVKSDGTTAYRTVTAAIDNLDGTQDLTLDSALAGALSRIEFLEQVRLDSDDVTVQWARGIMSCELVARVTQLATAAAGATFDDLETSVQDGAPVELYTLETSAGTLRFTSAAEDVTFGGNDYTAIPLSRSNVTPPTISESRELVVTMPVDHAAAQDLLSNGIPQQQIALTIARIHSTAGSSRQIWRGFVAGATTDQQWLRIRTVRDLEETFSVQLPIAKGSRTCQHQLYDAGCNAGSLAVFIDIATVNGTTITLDPAFAEADGWANGGDIVATADDRRTVLTQVGTTLTIDVPFRNVTAGQTVLVRAGCDHTAETCRDKFGNVVNFGGHPQMPSAKPTAPSGYGVIVQS